MKKYLIVLAAVILGLASCKKKPEPDALKLSINPAEAVLMVGDTTILAAVSSTGTLPADLVWTSSDTSVIKIEDAAGTIVVVGGGEADVTISAEGFTAGVCHITAAFYEELWSLDWLYYFPSTQAVFEDEIVEIQGYKCKLYTIEFFAPNPLDFNEDLTVGDGECLFATAVVPFIEEGDHKGEMLARAFKVVDKEEDLAAFTALKGWEDPSITGAVIQAYLESYVAGSPAIDWTAYESGLGGVHIGEAEITEEGSISYSYIFDGLINSGTIQLVRDEEGNGSMDYEFQATWLGGFWGIAYNPDELIDEEDPLTYLAQPFQLAPYATFNYKSGQVVADLVVNEAPRRAPKANAIKSAPRIVREKPVRVKFAPVAK